MSTILWPVSGPVYRASDTFCAVWWHGLYHTQHGPEEMKESVVSGDWKEMIDKHDKGKS